MLGGVGPTGIRVPYQVILVHPSDDLVSVLSYASSGDVLLLASGVYKPAATGDFGLQINKNITIAAQQTGQAVLDGQKQRGVLSITAVYEAVGDLNLLKSSFIVPMERYETGLVRNRHACSRSPAKRNETHTSVTPAGPQCEATGDSNLLKPSSIAPCPAGVTDACVSFRFAVWSEHPRRFRTRPLRNGAVSSHAGFELMGPPQRPVGVTDVCVLFRFAGQREHARRFRTEGPPQRPNGAA
eukprot:4536982-Prymnesium_polylepis.1